MAQMVDGGGQVRSVDGLICPIAFPVRSVEIQPEQVEAAAATLRGVGAGVQERVSRIGWRWQALAGVYEAPEQELALGLMEPAVAEATLMRLAMRGAASALDTLAGELVGIKRDLADLEERAEAFRQEALAGYWVTRAEAEGGMANLAYVTVTPRGDVYTNESARPDEYVHVDWRSYQPAVDRNNALLAELEGLLSRLSAADQEAGREIRGQTRPEGLGDGKSGGDVSMRPDSEGYYAGSGSGAVPGRPPAWGWLVDRDPNASERYAYGALDVLNGGLGLVGVHVDLEHGGGLSFSLDRLGASWGGVAESVGTMIVAGPVGTVVFGLERSNQARTRVVGDMLESVGFDVQAALEGRDGWHRYEEDPARMTGMLAASLTLPLAATPVGMGVSVGVRAALRKMFGPSVELPEGAAQILAFEQGAGRYLITLEFVDSDGTLQRLDLAVVDGRNDPLPEGVRELLAAAGVTPDQAETLHASNPLPQLRPETAPVLQAVTGREEVVHAPVTTILQGDHFLPARSQQQVEHEGLRRGEVDAIHEATAYDGPKNPNRPDQRDRNAALARAFGDGTEPVDHRDGQPLRGPVRVQRADGTSYWRSGWHMQPDPSGTGWIAQNPGAPKPDGTTPGAPLDAKGNQMPAPYTVDPHAAARYPSGQAHLPGGHPPHTPPETYRPEAGPDGSGFHFFNRGQDPSWGPYQSQVTGLLPDEQGRIPEWMQYDPNTGKYVAFDTRTHRGDTEVFI
ncbi:MAG: hypothetical protein Q4E05_10450, partial [Pseudoclavibacter sp.]|nr:hypothetical protein [Pseudoclavibacter sp.]